MAAPSFWDFLEALTVAGCRPERRGDNVMARCPGHEDANPSLSLREGRGGRALWNCFGGCENSAVLAALNLSSAPTGRRAAGATPRATKEPGPLPTGPNFRHFFYQDAAGDPALVVVREDRPGAAKKITQWTPRSGDWVPGRLQKTGLPPFRLPEIMAAATGPVVVAEGETSCLAVAAIWPETAATCWAGGASTGAADRQAWRLTDWTPLREREVRLVADGDEPGRKSMQTLAAHLARLGCKVKLALPEDGDPDGSDVRDWLRSLGVSGAAAKIADMLVDYTPEAGGGADRPLVTDAPAGLAVPPPSPGDANIRYLTRRFLRDFAEELVIALDPADSAPARVCLVAPDGVLRQGQFVGAAIQETIRSLHLDLLDQDFERRKDLDDLIRFVRAAYRSGDLAEVNKQVGFILAGFLSQDGAYPAPLVVVLPQDLDADFSVMGTQEGVWFFPEGRLLNPDEARRKLVTVRIPWRYNPDSRHPMAEKLWEHFYGPPTQEPSDDVRFWRWRAAASALVRRPMKELMVKVCESNSGKTSEDNLNLFAFMPYVGEGERAAIEAPGRFNRGGSSHNSFLAAYGAPTRRLNVSEFVPGARDIDPPPLNAGLLKRMADGPPTIDYRLPGPYSVESIPFHATLFLSGNLPKPGEDVLSIADDGDQADALRTRLRGLPFERISSESRDPALKDFGNPHGQHRAEARQFNETIVRLMFDSIRCNWSLLQKPMPENNPASEAVIRGIKQAGQPRWRAEWLPDALVYREPGTGRPANAAETYADYLAWRHTEGEPGDPEPQRVITEAVWSEFLAPLSDKPKTYVTGSDGKRKKVVSFTNFSEGQVLVLASEEEPGCNLAT